MSSQFYDKFNIRYNISQILKNVWNDPSHRLKFIAESKDKEYFVKFVNLLMNDTTYLLDEGLTKLSDIRNLENEMENEAEWRAKPQVCKSLLQRRNCAGIPRRKDEIV